MGVGASVEPGFYSSSRPGGREAASSIFGFVYERTRQLRDVGEVNATNRCETLLDDFQGSHSGVSLSFTSFGRSIIRRCST